jgi:hypothetical protein
VSPFLAALFCALAAAPTQAPGSDDAGAAARIDTKNWHTHPRIVTIRSVVEENEAAITSGTWRPEKRKGCSSRKHSFEVDAVVVRDGRGRIRKYTTAEGTDDSAYRIEHHYDDEGRLRFAFAKAGAFNDSEVVYRLYFDEHGREIWRHETSSGPGYTFIRPPDFPDAALVRDPVQDLATPKKCDPEPPSPSSPRLNQLNQ